ncbi:MAG TPA: hypothetical protein VIL65_13755 [Beijerinckiaceae bacterium]|jgi:protein-disulfide isomerase-like protein with CxxC motif
MQAMVDALPATGAVVVTHAPARRKDLVAFIQERRGADVARACQVIVVSSVADAEQGLRDEGRPVAFDHTFYLHASFAAIAMAEKLADACSDRANREAVSVQLRLRLRDAAP